jgi:hypothetical protein
VPVRGLCPDGSPERQSCWPTLKGDERMEPASITKLMTAYVIYKALKTGKIHLA